MLLRVISRALLIALVAPPLVFTRADDAPAKPASPAAKEAQPGLGGPPAADERPKVGPELTVKGLTRLTPRDEVWIDVKRKIVVANAKVCLRRGVLELFACPRGTKEHESVVSVNSKAQVVHAALLAVGGRQGKPVQFAPKYAAATGMEIDVWVLWKDTKGVNRKVRAQEWIRNIKTGKAMTQPWVFAGSGFYVDDMTGEKFYQADANGDLICVSNFSTATLDLPIKSSAEAADILYESYTDRIPARGTVVRLVLIPKVKGK